MKCPECNLENTAKAKFCVKCGIQLSEATADTSTEPATPAARVQPEVVRTGSALGLVVAWLVLALGVLTLVGVGVVIVLAKVHDAGPGDFAAPFCLVGFVLTTAGALLIRIGRMKVSQ